MDKQFLIEHYTKHFPNLPSSKEMHFSFCPYRICPIGAHVDHQQGFVTGFAINFGINIVYTINNDNFFEIVSHNFQFRKSFYADETLKKNNDWCDYIRGCVKTLIENGYKIKHGISAYVYGDIPVGGLSSSAAISIVSLKAIAFANDIILTKEEIIEFSYLSEKNFVGVSIGKLDQSCEVLAQKEKLLFLDTKTGEYENISLGKSAKPFKLLIVHSGAERKLTNSFYNIRVDECKSVAFTINAFTNTHKKFKDCFLRDVEYNDFISHKKFLPENFVKRAMHFYSENKRVKDGVLAWQNGDIKSFGKIVSASGKSSIELYEAGSKYLISLYNIMVKTKGIYGTRFLGGGFNGACFAIIDPNYEKEIIENIKEKYLAIFPDLKEKINFYICQTENGIGV